MPIAQLTTNGSSGWAVATPAASRERVTSGATTSAVATTSPTTQVAERVDSSADMTPQQVVAQVQQALSRPEVSAQINARQLKINVDDSSGKVVISVYDTATDKLVRQFPPDEVLHMAELITNILEQRKGSLLNEKI